MEKLYGKDLSVMAYKARLLAVEAVHRAASGHPGGSLSCADALTALYFNEMKVDPTNPKIKVLNTSMTLNPYDLAKSAMTKGYISPFPAPIGICK